MISGHSNYFQVVINMSKVPIENGGGGEIAQLIRSVYLAVKFVSSQAAEP